MAFDNTAWLIDGALTKAELARRAHYQAMGGSEGVGGLGDLKVIPLSTPGNGVRVSVGGGSVLNRYITPLNQMYSVSNPTIETIDSTKMPPSNPAARSHLVVAAVGDPQYSADGHPYMPSSMLGEDLDTFQYVRPWVIPNVPAGTTKFSQLGLNYPAIELARLDIGAGSTTYTSGTIVDLRTVARPRSKDVQWHDWATDADTLNVVPLTYETWPDSSAKAVEIPEWASMCYVDGFLNGILDGNTARTQARIRVSCLSAPGGAIATEYTQYDVSAPQSPYRTNVLLGGTMKIPAALRGTTQVFEISATTLNAESNLGLGTDIRTSCMVHLRFVEEPD